MSTPFLDTTVTIALSAVIQHFVESALKFTALDASRVLQRGGVRERHRNLKHVVHDLFASGDMVMNSGRLYERSLVDVGGADGDAYVYHPEGSDPNDYEQIEASEELSMLDPRASHLVQKAALVVPTSTQPTTTQQCHAPRQTSAAASHFASVRNSAPAVVRGSTPGSVRGGVKQADGSRMKSLDVHQRLRIPAQLLRAAGAEAGDIVYVAVDAADGSLHVAPQHVAADDRAYRVDRYNNVRFKVHGGGQSDTYEIRLNGLAVVAEPSV